MVIQENIAGWHPCIGLDIRTESSCRQCYQLIWKAVSAVFRVHIITISTNFESRYARDLQVDAGAGIFAPIPSLGRVDGDVAVRLTTKNSIKYRQPVNDLMFSAPREFSWTLEDGNHTYYAPDFPGSAIGGLL